MSGLEVREMTKKNICYVDLRKASAFTKIFNSRLLEFPL